MFFRELFCYPSAEAGGRPVPRPAPCGRWTRAGAVLVKPSAPLPASRPRYTIRKVLVGERREVLHLRLGSIPPPRPSQPSHPSHETPPQSQDPSGTGRSNGTVTAAEGVRPSHETVPQSFASEFKMDSAGTDGTVGTVVDTYSPPNVQRTAEGMRTHPPTAPTSMAGGTVEERV